MADPHDPHYSTEPQLGPATPDRLAAAEQHDHHAHLFKIYMIVAVVLAVCTASSFVFNKFVHEHLLTAVMGFVLILGVAVLKAFLVGFYFMHLKWDWRLLYFIIVPVFILGVMMVIILMPDCVIGPGRDAAEAIVIGDELP
jgi:cytochrome c oxidase subunit IV